MSIGELLAEVGEKLSKNIGSSIEEQRDPETFLPPGCDHQDTQKEDLHELPQGHRRFTGRRTSSIPLSMSDGIIDFRESGGSFASSCNHSDWERNHSCCHKKKEASE